MWYYIVFADGGKGVKIKKLKKLNCVIFNTSYDDSSDRGTACD